MRYTYWVALIGLIISMYLLVDYTTETVPVSILVGLLVYSIVTTFEVSSIELTRRVFVTTLLLGLVLNHVLDLRFTAFLLVLLVVETFVKTLRFLQALWWDRTTLHG
ncbi:hypothetical protein [Exiguobacterium sp. R-39]|uniref:hypothetical protein n=1 Tax=Exiguobacterium sp. R-39 TaxID=3416708 RepID=UPI003CF3D011